MGNWKKALDRFDKHVKLAMHREAVLKINSLRLQESRENLFCASTSKNFSSVQYVTPYLNHITILCIHKERTDHLDMLEIARNL